MDEDEPVYVLQYRGIMNSNWAVYRDEKTGQYLNQELTRDFSCAWLSITKIVTLPEAISGSEIRTMILKHKIILAAKSLST